MSQCDTDRFTPKSLYHKYNQYSEKALASASAFSMISVPCGTGDIATAMISASQMIYASRMKGTDIISYFHEVEIYHTAFAVYHISSEIYHFLHPTEEKETTSL